MKMKHMVLMALSPCCLLVAGANADTSSWEEKVMSNAFFADSEFDISTRNMWKYLKTENRYNSSEGRYATQVAQAWGQGLTVDYRSGYFADFIGFDASYYAGIKLAASDDFSSRAILYNDDGKAKSYNKVGQRYVKMKMDLDPVKINVKGGWFTIKNTGIFTNSQRLSLNTHNGWFANIAAGDFSVDALYLDTKVMRRDSPNIQKMSMRDGNGVTQSIDHVLTGGLNYKTKPLTLYYFYGAADSLYRQHGLEGTYKITPNVTLSTQIYYQEYGSDGKRTISSSSLGRQNFDKRASHYAGSIDWSIPETPWKLSAGLTHTEAKKSNGVGQYARNAISNTRGRFNSPAYADIDYTRDGETMLALAAEYKISKELSVGLRTNYSQFSYKGETLKQGQIGPYTYWAPTKNLSVSLSGGYGWHHQQENDYTTPKLYNGRSQRAHSLSGSMTTTYRFKM